ncbi:MAG: DUF7901 domain-containing protein [Planctomycetota bacterium]|jgi:hypothetical protein
MKDTSNTLAILLLLTLSPLSAVADWDLGQRHKMHFPQTPDPDGWDVNMTLFGLGGSFVLADDWSCAQSGPVSNIHFWFSSGGDHEPLSFFGFAVAIFEDIPADQSDTGFSKPGDTLWVGDFQRGEITIREWGEGTQNWYDPRPPEPTPTHHQQVTIYQANVVDVPTPFFQEEGRVYWLGLTVWGDTEPPWIELGWKTSLDDWNDTAVWGSAPAVDPIVWSELRHPDTDEPFSLAFVIVPEPSTLIMLLSAGLAGLLACVWRSRSRSAGRTN